ncbi:SDR family oxidoreductase [Maribacter aestuarii]|uniref:SDR family oxidoreductase n=1 Tax=Maribacter aestuarii TaxID=1130723 RepID=UPI00248AC653|nr:SDR family oxidoreductase [Maribacter aestuarii]
MTKSVGVLGCGWLGLPLAKNLVGQGYSVKGTTTSKNKLEILRNAGIVPYQVSLSEENIRGPISDFLKNLHVLIINVPPGFRGKGPKESYVKKMGLLHKATKQSPIEKVIFVSSTSVYGDIKGEVNEETTPKPVTESGKQLLDCERLFKEDENLQCTIIRFGGLIGPDRHPVTMLSGKKNVKGGNAPVNLIHLNDCINLISTIIKGEQWNQIINGVFPDHPLKKDYYTEEAKKRGLAPPQYKDDEGESDKKIDTCKLFLIKNKVLFTPIRS